MRNRVVVGIVLSAIVLVIWRPSWQDSTVGPNGLHTDIHETQSISTEPRIKLPITLGHDTEGITIFDANGVFVKVLWEETLDLSVCPADKCE